MRQWILEKHGIEFQGNLTLWEVIGAEADEVVLEASVGERKYKGIYSIVLETADLMA